jgi:uncharacterized protein YhbP (UPF0306 family)
MLKILEESQFAYLCTTDQDNQSHITPMFFVFDEKTGDLLAFTKAKSKKMRNIQANPKVCLTVDVRDPQDPFKNTGVMVQGKAIIERPSYSFSTKEDEKLTRIYGEFKKKYPVLSEAQAPTRLKYEEFTEALVRVHANKMVYWKGPHFVTVKFEQKST